MTISTDMDAPQIAPIARDEFEGRVSRLKGLLKDHGFDGVVISDYAIGQPGMAWIPNSSYVRFLSGFHVPASPASFNAIIVVPAEGDPILVVPPGIRNSFRNIARAQTWIEKVVGYYDDSDERTGPPTRWGMIGSQGPDVADALRDAGLAQGRIGVAGTWIGIDETKAALPEAIFAPTVVSNDSGGTADFLAQLMSGSSPAEVKRLEAAHAAADAAVRRFIEAALSGATRREAHVEGQIAGLRAGASEVVLFGSVLPDPWAFWDLRMAPPDEPFQEGKLYFVENAHTPVDGYSIETARSFVIGTATERQRTMLRAVKESAAAMFEAVAVGRTGEEIWEVGIEPARRAGLEAWAQLGHNEGWKPWTRVTSFLPESKEPFEVGQVLVLHPCLFDPVTRSGGMGGDSIVLEESGRPRWLSKNPTPYELG